MKLLNNFGGMSLTQGFTRSVLTCSICAVMSGAAYAEDVIELGTVSASRDAVAAPAQPVSRLQKVQQDPLKDLPAAAKAAMSQGSLQASSAQSHVSESFIQNQLTPSSDFAGVVSMTPGTFSFSPNGAGLGQASTYFRGFSDGNYSMTFDGIPFQDTNSPTHHSWVFFPSQIIGGAVVDRSPGTASSIGPANFGGTIGLQSKAMNPIAGGSVTASVGTWDTTLFAAQLNSGNFGPEGSSNLQLNANQLNSDGYQTYNEQQRQNFAAKYQYALTENTILTLFGTTQNVKANTPNGSPTRGQLDKFGKDYLLVDDPTQPNYVGYNDYHIHTDFEYLGLASDLGWGWKLDDKLYGYDYHNAQFYDAKLPGAKNAIGPAAAVNKLNAYHTFGNILRLSQDSSLGTLRLGLWTERANTNRHQIPSDPASRVDQPLPNFSEAYTTDILQPYVEYEFHVTDALKITPGVKYSRYAQDFTQFADNGKVVGNLGGQPSITHKATYHDTLPSIDVHYLLDKNWSVYAQYAYGDVIPLTNVFDVTGANVLTQPKPTLSKTAQIGSVYKSDRFTFDVDAYRIKFDNSYASSKDPVSGETVYYAAGTSTAQGLEAESNILLGNGFSLYLNATYNRNRYDSGSLKGQTANNSPSQTEALGLTYSDTAWNVGVIAKHIGAMWNNNGAVIDAVKIDPFNTANLFVNYTKAWASHPGYSTKFQFAVNNVFGNQDIVGVSPANGPTPTVAFAPDANDQITLTAPRSVTFSITQNF